MIISIEITDKNSQQTVLYEELEDLIDWIDSHFMNRTCYSKNDAKKFICDENLIIIDKRSGREINRKGLIEDIWKYMDLQDKLENGELEMALR